MAEASSGDCTQLGTYPQPHQTQLTLDVSFLPLTTGVGSLQCGWRRSATSSPQQRENQSPRQPPGCKESSLAFRCSEGLLLKTGALHPLPQNDFYPACFCAAKLGNASCEGSQKRNRFACSWVVRALWLSKGSDNAVKGPADGAAPSCTRSFHMWLTTNIAVNMASKGCSHVKMLKTQRSPDLAKSAPLRKEVCRRKENDT